VPVAAWGLNGRVIAPARAVSAVGAAFRNENIRRVELAWGAAIAAEWSHFVALGVFAYHAGGTSAVGIAGLVRLLPAALVAPFASSLGDRFRRERFLLTVTLVEAGALAGSAAAAFAKERVLVFAFAAIVGLASTLFRPALQALLPSLARTTEELIASNGATSTLESLGTLVGPLFAGALVSFANVGFVFVVAGGVLLVAALLLARVRVDDRFEFALSATESARGMVSAGLRTVAHTPKPRLLIGLVAAQCFVRGCLNVLIVVAVFRVLHEGAGAVGYLTAAIGVGGLFGAFGAMALEGRRLAVPFGLALVFWGLPILLIAPRPYFVAAVFLLAIVGAANSVEDVAVFTLLQRIVPDQLLTRVLGVLWGLAMAAVAIGSIATPAIVAAIGTRSAFVVVGAILPLLTFSSYRRLHEIDRTLAVPAAELQLIDEVPMFAPLSLAAKERLATKLAPVTIVPGEIVIRAGDIGDRFYIVADGELAIDADGTQARAHAGDYFGEIALLRDVPRTATVKAVVGSRLYALERSDFLATITGHSAAHTAAEAVADARLAGNLSAT
jgi:MFS family permease